jgi:hypothetical protein
MLEHYPRFQKIHVLACYPALPLLPTYVPNQSSEFSISYSVTSVIVSASKLNQQIRSVSSG